MSHNHLKVKVTPINSEVGTKKQLLVINQFAQDLINICCSEELLHYVTQRVVAQTGYVDCVIYLLDRDRGILVQKSAYGEKIDDQYNIVDAIEIPLGKGISGQVAKTGEAIIISDTRDDPNYIYDLGSGLSEICVPITIDGRVLGVIDCEHPEKDHFNEEHKSFLTTVATMLAGRLREWNLLEELHKSRSELSLAVAAAEESNKAKSEFLTSMSHDLRTPLNAIIGFSEVMRGEIFGKMDNPRYAGYVDDIFDSSQYLLSLVNDILDLSELEASERKMVPEYLDVMGLYNNCYNLLHRLAADKDITLGFDVVRGMSPLYADKRAMMQIVMNLVSNAIKFTHNNGEVIMRAFEDNTHHHVIIEDNGVGITQEYIEKITEPFVRETGGPFYSAQEGTGLGLSIVKSLTELQGGTFLIESENHEGTKVTISIPKPDV